MIIKGKNYLISPETIVFHRFKSYPFRSVFTVYFYTVHRLIQPLRYNHWIKIDT